MEKVWKKKFEKFGRKFCGIICWKIRLKNCVKKILLKNCVDHLVEKLGGKNLLENWLKSCVKNCVEKLCGTIGWKNWLET